MSALSTKSVPALPAKRARIVTPEGNGNVGIHVNLPKLEKQIMDVTVIGETPLIVHAWSSKAIKIMLGKQTDALAQTGRSKTAVP